MVGAREHVLGHVALSHDALDDAAAVAHLEEVDLAARPSRRQPAAQRDRLTVGDPDPVPDLLDTYHAHGERIPDRRGPVTVAAAPWYSPRPHRRIHACSASP